MDIQRGLEQLQMGRQAAAANTTATTGGTNTTTTSAGATPTTQTTPVAPPGQQPGTNAPGMSLSDVSELVNHNIELSPHLCMSNVLLWVFFLSIDNDGFD